MRTAQQNPFLWLLLLLTAWACLAAPQWGAKTASGKFYGWESASGEMTGWEAAPRLGFGGLAENNASAALVGAKGGTAVSPIVPGGGLAVHEAAGGHLLLKHVGQSESALATRLAAEPRIPAASTFLSRSEAEAAVSAVLDVRAAEVATWVASGAKGQLVLNAPFNGGLVLQRGASAGASGSGATVVLRGTGGGEWRIHTGYPTP